MAAGVFADSVHDGGRCSFTETHLDVQHLVGVTYHSGDSLGQTGLLIQRVIAESVVPIQY